MNLAAGFVYEQKQTQRFLEIEIEWGQEELGVYGVVASLWVVAVWYAYRLEFFEVPENRASARAEHSCEVVYPTAICRLQCR